MSLQLDVTPVKIAILAMGGEGGGVLADWIVATAEHAGFHAQTTSVPGVAQRTGATIYYVEVLPVPRASAPVPILSLMPVPGDVDVVLASELMESARAVQRGLVTRDKTLLLASSNRVYAMPEKTAMGDGRQDSRAFIEAGRKAARQFICRDFAAIAETHGSVISAALFGALAASGALPLSREDFEATIQRSGVGVANSLAAFDAGFQACRDEASGSTVTPDSSRIGGVTLDARLADLDACIARDFPDAAHAILRAGVERTADYQDPDYARSYLDHLRPIAAIDALSRGSGRLLETVARHLALWMTYEDTVRVAELKIRRTRFDRVRHEHKVPEGQLFEIKEFFHPRLEEIADTLPKALGNWLLRTSWARNLVGRFTRKGRIVHSNRMGGFLLLYSVAALRGMRRLSLRHAREHAEIVNWLRQIDQYAHAQYELACEIALCQGLVKGYGDTHARGLKNYRTIMTALPHLSQRPDAAAQLAQLRKAALADEQGKALEQQLAALPA